MVVGDGDRLSDIKCVMGTSYPNEMTEKDIGDTPVCTVISIEYLRKSPVWNLPTFDIFRDIRGSKATNTQVFDFLF